MLLGAGNFGLAGFFDALNTPEMQIERVRTSVELFFSDIRSALEEPEGNPKLKVLGTEAATLGVYLRDANDAEDLSERSALVWSVFNEVLARDPAVAEMAPDPTRDFAASIIQHLAVSLVTIRCNEGLERVQLDAGMEVGKFLKEVHDQGVRLEFIPGDARFYPDDRKLESASIRRNLKSSGEKIIGTLFSEYQNFIKFLISL